MSRILIINQSIASPNKLRIQKKSQKDGRGFLLNKQNFSSGKVELSWIAGMFIVMAGVFLGGIFYLYQVNNIATKGYEIRDLERHIQDLSKESRKMEIREVELKSMYNIEKSSKDLNLVNADEFSYVEINDPVAMK